MDLARELNRPPPQDDAIILDRCVSTWQRAYALLRGRSEPLNAASASLLFSGLCSWRYHRVMWTCEKGCEARLQAHFLVEAAVRLALLDWFARVPRADRPEWLDDLPTDEHPLGVHERSAIAPFEATDIQGAIALMEAQGERFRDAGADAAALAPTAYALLVTDEASETLEMNAERARALAAAERWSRALAARAVLVRFSLAARAHDPVALTRDRIQQWALRRAITAQGDAIVKAVEDAVALDRCDPTSLPSTASASSAIACGAPLEKVLIAQPPRVATAAADGARHILRAFARGEVSHARDVALVTFALIDYATRQATGTEWAQSFTCSDARPRAALDLVRRYTNDRVAAPPPLLALVGSSVYAIGRVTVPGPRGPRGKPGNVTVHDDPYEALERWFTETARHPVLGRRFDTIIRDILTDPDEGDADVHMLPVGGILPL